MTDFHSDLLDSNLRLSDILSAENLERLQKNFGRLFCCPVVIVDSGVQAKPGWRRAPVPWELEPIGYIEAERATVEQLAAGADLLVMMVKATMQYRLAAALHLETTLADYNALVKQHEKLQESEQRYRDLSGRLEEKVAAQVEEIHSAQLKIYQAEKLASIGRLAAGVAHELNTPLAFILNNMVTGKEYLADITSFLQSFQEGKDRDTLRQLWQELDIDYLFGDFDSLLTDSLEGVRRAAAIVGDLKVFANLNRQEYTEIDIHEKLQDVLKMLKSQIEDMRVEITIDEGTLPRTYCYPAMLAQVFYNLIQNGVQATTSEGRIRISTAMEAGEIRVTIADSGSGIAKENLTRIFEPFFSTKEVGSGTGLGLSVAYDILKAHRGRIEVVSELGAGSSFSVFLPVSTNPFPEETGLVGAAARDTEIHDD